MDNQPASPYAPTSVVVQEEAVVVEDELSPVRPLDATDRSSGRFGRRGSRAQMTFLDSDCVCTLAQIADLRAKDVVMQTTLFEFDSKFVAERDIIPAVDITPDAAEVMPEPQTGIDPVGINPEGVDQQRHRLQFLAHKPSLFERRARIATMRTPSQIPTPNRLMGLRNMQHARPEHVSLIWLDGQYEQPLAPKYRAQIGQHLSYFNRTEVLILRGLGLSKLPGLVLPYLRYCDLTGNQIARADDIRAMFEASRFLEVLDLTNNPVTQSPHWPHSVIAAVPTVWNLNAQAIQTEDRLAALGKYGSKEQKASLPFERFDLLFSSLPVVRQMTHWNPAAIQHIDMPSLGLETFHVGPLVNLVVLNLADNKLTTLIGCGLEQCSRLRTLNVRKNRLTRERAFPVLPWLSSLRVLFLLENPEIAQPYRITVIFETRNLRGSNRNIGLLDLDGQQVTDDERLEALTKLAHMKPPELEAARWHMQLIHYYGHYQLRTLGYLSKVTIMQIPRHKLTVADLREFVNLRVLDLSGNDLQFVSGLEKLQRLEYVDISNNRLLKVEVVLEQLSTQNPKLTTLEQVSLSNDIRKPNPKIRQMILEKFVVTHPRLCAVDKKLITIEERLDCHRKLLSPLDLDAYRFGLGVLLDVVKPSKRTGFAPADVKIGKQYDPLTITKLWRMNGHGLMSVNARLTVFPNLEEINLSNNRITDLYAMGLHELPKLRILDVSNNKIDYTMQELAEFIDEMPAIEILVLKGNPCMVTPLDRQDLLSHMKCLHDVDCKLRILDTEIDINERVEAWKLTAGRRKESPEVLRFKFTLSTRVDHSLAVDKITALNLNNAKLQLADLRLLVNLEVLLLCGNEFSSTKKIAGLQGGLPRLQYLDLRRNKLKQMIEIITLIDTLPWLRSLGIAENDFKGDKPRDKILATVPRLRQVDNRFTMLDDQEITLDEVSEMWKRSGGSEVESEKFRYQATLYRKIAPDVVRSSLVQLNLSSCKLTFIDLFEFVNLELLSLSNNQLTSNSLTASGVHSLAKLTGLDIRHNNIQHVAAVGKVINLLKNLEMLFCEGNPCFKQNTEQYRVGFLKEVTSIMEWECPLKFLNGDPPTIDERCSAIALRKPGDHVESLRQEFVFHELGAQPDWTTLELCHAGLRRLDELKRFSGLKHLDLSFNRLETLQGQGLDQLKELQFIDLRENQISSMTDLLMGLSTCHKLKVVGLRNSTRDGSTEKVEVFSKTVFHRLRGLEHCDNRPNPRPLTDIQLSVLASLLQFDIGPNSCVVIDLSGRGLSGESNFQELCSKLGELPVEELRINNNPWDTEVPNASALLVYSCKQLRLLNGMQIGDAQRGESVVHGAGMYGKASGPSGMAPDHASPDADPSSANPGDVMIAMTADAQPIQRAARFVSRSKTSVGTSLHKIEIIVSWLQILALLSVLPGITLPSAWETWIVYLRALMLEFDFSFGIFTIPYKPYFLFFGYLVLPILCLIMFKSTMKSERWDNDYIDKWGRAVGIAVGLWFFLGLVGSAAAAFFLDYSTNVQRFNSGTLIPSRASLAFFGISGGLLTFWFVLHLCVIGTYRRMRLHADMDEFLHFWSTLKKLKQRLALFALTVLYMPIVRQIVLTFNCVTSGNTLIIPQWTYTINDQFLFVASCPMGTLSWQQIVALVFAAAWGIGIPIVLCYMIQTNVKDVVANQLQPYIAEIEALQQSSDPHLKGKISQKQRDMEFEYIWTIRFFKEGVAYLNIPYSLRLRYYKVFQMLEKVLLVVIVYILNSTQIASALSWLQSILATGVVCLYFIIGLLTRAHMDKLEDAMDLSSHLANTVAGVVAVLTVFNVMNTTLALIVLFAVQGANLFVVLFCLLLVPIRTWYNRREALQGMKDQFGTAAVDGSADVPTKTDDDGPTGRLVRMQSVAGLTHGDDLVEQALDQGFDDPIVLSHDEPAAVVITELADAQEGIPASDADAASRRASDIHLEESSTNIASAAHVNDANEFSAVLSPVQPTASSNIGPPVLQRQMSLGIGPKFANDDGTDSDYSSSDTDSDFSEDSDIEPQVAVERKLSRKMSRKLSRKMSRQMSRGTASTAANQDEFALRSADDGMERIEHSAATVLPQDGEGEMRLSEPVIPSSPLVPFDAKAQADVSLHLEASATFDDDHSEEDSI
eukprot:TRINITY_DN7670_c0_g1_i1.p1 TRINITY_DN7670_c0_g1~~TRINITY_DN7670_c0_g1_i1.p1  ORF type:complete len:2182 (-),score=499.73 TRINITY_DN7670_c0_g1_i1:26-6466(-)